MAALCPCGSGLPFADCCRPALRGAVKPATAEQLMRSRYTAYVRGDATYVSATWHPSTRPAQVETDADWRGLDVIDVVDGASGQHRGTVTFAAHYADADGDLVAMRETSRFVFEHGAWWYVDGDVD